MTELRSVDPRTLAPNPNNPRRTPAPKAHDDQLLASIKAIGIIQPPVVTESADGTLTILAGSRRTEMAIAAKLDTIDVVVANATEAENVMRSMSENVVRAPMNGVDIWRGIEALEAQGWNEQAIADALAQPVRMIRRLKLLARLHPPMLDVMAAGSMPNEDQLRTIAAATREEQAQVWKKHKPKKGHQIVWSDLAHALAKRRIPFATAKFDAEMATAYGVTWLDDLFAPAGEESRFTTDVEGFFAAQQAWLADNLPAGGTLLRMNEYNQPELPKKAERLYGKPAKGDLTGHCLDPYSGEVKTISYRLPAAKPVSKPNGSSGAGADGHGAAADGDGTPLVKARADVTQKGMAILGDLRTAALHEALHKAEIDDQTLMGMLVLAFAGKNVSVQAPGYEAGERQDIASTLTEGGILTNDADAVRTAARRMLAAVLSCRDNMTDSGPVARTAGDAIGASLRLPTMATEEFLSCLSKAAIEQAAAAEGVRVELRGKDTRARLIKHFEGRTYVYPAALFQLTDTELATMTADAARRASWVGNAAPENGDAPDEPDGDDVADGSEQADAGNDAPAEDAAKNGADADVSGFEQVAANVNDPAQMADAAD